MVFVIPLTRTGEPLSSQICAWLRAAIRQGTLSFGERLPSTRELAEQLNVSRTIVLLAYEQLIAEGLVIARPGSGTFVSAITATAQQQTVGRAASLHLSRFGDSAASIAHSLTPPPPRAPSLPYDFAYGRSEVEAFPFKAWRRILVRQARKVSPRDLDYGPPAGSSALREEICTLVRRVRAVACDPSQVIVVSGSQQALDLIARVLLERSDPVVVEDPVYQGTSAIVRAAGARIIAVPIDRNGLNPGYLPHDARAAFVTPSHQFPTGVVLPLDRRLALLDWAGRRNATIIEDDYDGEFCYEKHPLQSLQGLDEEGRVIHIGTFSRTVYSALRIGYVIVPRSLVATFTAAKWLTDRHTPTLEQETLAEFIRTGMYERHLLRVRRRNIARRKALLQAIERYLGERVEVTGANAGAHVVLWPGMRVCEATVLERAASRGVQIYGISGYYLSKPPAPGVLLGYSRMSEPDIREGIRRLSEVL